MSEIQLQVSGDVKKKESCEKGKPGQHDRASRDVDAEDTLSIAA